MERERPPHLANASQPRYASSTKPPRRLEAEVLFRDGPEVEILHAGEVYRLRLTRAGKLILTK